MGLEEESPPTDGRCEPGLKQTSISEEFWFPWWRRRGFMYCKRLLYAILDTIYMKNVYLGKRRYTPVLIYIRRRAFVFDTRKYCRLLRGPTVDVTLPPECNWWLLLMPPPPPRRATRCASFHKNDTVRSVFTTSSTSGLCDNYSYWHEVGRIKHFCAKPFWGVVR